MREWPEGYSRRRAGGTAGGAHVKGAQMRRARIVGSVAAVTAVGLATLSGIAEAKPFAERFHDETSEVVEDFCESGLTVRFDRVVDGRFQGGARGPDGLIYFAEHVSFTSVVTNEANGNMLTDKGRVLTKDLSVVDNGDGTLTVNVLATGPFTLYGPDGKAIARDPGQVRFALLIDHGGTPTDPSDDTELDFEVTKESTGRSDDVCAIAVAALTA
jgi:hypothetical protein